MSTILVAAANAVYFVDSSRGVTVRAKGLEQVRPSCLSAAGPGRRASWCGTDNGGVFRTDNGGRSWTSCGLGEERVMSIAMSPTEDGTVWVGTEPSAVWRSDDSGEHWVPCRGLDDLPSSTSWAFPPRPETHHVRWIECHPLDPGRLWVAIEAGALISTPDRGTTWADRVPGGPYDTHQLAVHPGDPEHLHSAAGDGYFESLDGGKTWSSSDSGLDVPYLRSVAVDPVDSSVVVVSAATHAHKAYMAGHADGRLYRREGGGAWERVTRGWPHPPSTIAPLLAAAPTGGGLVAADERGVHESRDSGRTWEQVADYPTEVKLLRGLAVL